MRSTVATLGGTCTVSTPANFGRRAGNLTVSRSSIATKFDLKLSAAAASEYRTNLKVQIYCTQQETALIIKRK